jgi:putative DNA primase/helicase
MKIEEDPPDRKQHIKEVANAICALFDFQTLMETGETLVQDKGVFKDTIAEPLIEREVEAMESEETNQFTREVVGHVKRSTYVESALFDADLDILNVPNGLLRISTGQLRPHDHNYLSRIQLGAKYDPKAVAVQTMRFLKQVLPDPNDVVNVLEDAAMALIRDARFQKAVMYIGAGDNGKSTWLKQLRALLGGNNVENLSIHDLAANRFAAGNVEGKLAVIYPDIFSTEITITGKVKAIIAGDPIDVEKKGIQPHPIVPYTKLYFSANELPIVADDSDAWFRRWRITSWTYRVKPEERDPSLLEKLTSEQELSGLLNILLAFARRLMKTNRFTYEATTQQTRVEWGDRSNVIKAFKSKCLNIQVAGGPELVALSADVYAAYVKFCLEQNFTPKKQTGFMEELKTVVAVRSETRRIGSKTPKFLVGVELKDAPQLSSVSGVASVAGFLSRPNTGDDESRGSKETQNTHNTRNADSDGGS